MDFTKLAFPTDIHAPFQNDRAVDVACQIMFDFDPEIVPAGSDGIDHYRVSSFDKDPARVKALTWQKEIDVWKKIQRKINDATPNAKRRPWISGNHEDRARRYVWAHPDLYGFDFFKEENLFSFADLGLEASEDNEVVINNLLVVKHGDRVSKFSAYTAKAELINEAYAICTLTGHTHRGGVHYQTTRFGVVKAAEGFCLCDTKPDYVKNPNWQLGIMLAEISDTFVNFEPVEFWTDENDAVHARWRGKSYRS